MRRKDEEKKPLIDHVTKSGTVRRCTDGMVHSFKIIIAPIRGASASASTFNTIAVHYKPGLWLIAPVGTGAMVSLTNEAVSALTRRYPDNRFLKALHKGTFFTDHGINGFFGDFGFAWSMITTVAIYAGGVKYYSNDFGNIIAPALAVLPAVMTRRNNYTNAQNRLTERSYARHAASLFRGTIAPSGVLGVLMQQQIIAVNSPIPTAVMGITGVLGLLASLFNEHCPALSKTLFAMINILCENPSLAAAFFHFPNDIYAAVHNDEISDEFFFSNVALTSTFLTMLTLVSLMNLFVAPQNNEEASVSEVHDEGSGRVLEDGFETKIGEEDSDEEDEETITIGSGISPSPSKMLQKHGVFASINTEVGGELEEVDLEIGL
ncbi:hypothetical protein [Legionella spiritensis]|uniref:hypothetical protein n=1 Tax=Legionella spiritensis TaxID=452 RepID=UPI000F7011FB|nr:hypothetical protein [Legionella spiritensis]VEG90472.1 Uncharacterised protein [Legionella spiritensis]